tara:strand:- start:348 stop:989 length:642 start_codon:yes stop_codon:yes gene_type:complete
MNEFYLGTLVGVVQTIIGHPLDTLKTNFQNRTKLDYQRNALKKLYSGVKYPLISSVITSGFIFYSNDCFNKKLDNHFYSGFITGITCTPLINFLEVFKVKAQIGLKNNISNFNLGITATLTRESLGTGIYFGSYNYLKKNNNAFISGSCAGLLSWSLTYPIDVIKTRLQSGDSKTWKQAINKGNLTSGMLVCLIRSFIVNGSSFTLYEYVKKL